MIFLSNRPLTDKRFSQRSSQRAVRLLCCAIVGLLLANAYGHFFLAADSSWARLLDVNREKNFATAFSALLLLMCAILLRKISITKWNSALCERHRQRFFRHWQGLSLLFFVMAIDECVLLHERLSMFLESHFHTHGIFHYAWVIPGSIFVLAFVTIYIRFLVNLPMATRQRFMIAGTLYLAGAIGMEMVSGYFIGAYGANSHHLLALLNGIEEAAEMFGAVAFIRALLIYLQLSGGDKNTGEKKLTSRSLEVSAK